MWTRAPGRASARGMAGAPSRDGSRHRVYKRFFDAAMLAAELGGGRVLHEGHWFVAVVASR